MFTHGAPRSSQELVQKCPCIPDRIGDRIPDLIVILQKRAVKIVNNSTYDANTGPILIFKKLELLKFHDIHLFQ